MGISYNVYSFLLKKNKKVIAASRLAKYKEHHNDHQKLFYQLMNKPAKQDLRIADVEEYDIYKNSLEDIEAELIIYKWHFGEDNYIKAVEKLSKAR
mgnify:CR=1 FL=1